MSQAVAIGGAGQNFLTAFIEDDGTVTWNWVCSQDNEAMAGWPKHHTPRKILDLAVTQLAAERAKVAELSAALTAACADTDDIERRLDEAEAVTGRLREALEDSQTRCTMRLKLSCEECYQHQVVYEVAPEDLCKVHLALQALSPSAAYDEVKALREKVVVMDLLVQALDPLDAIMAAAEDWEDIDQAAFGKVFERVFIAYWAYKDNEGANAPGTHTAEDVQAQYDRQKGRCYYCHKKLDDKYHIDHVIPLAKGGSDGPENLVVACQFCNLSKHDKHPMDFDGRMF
jgi:hypothetical protein